MSAPLALREALARLRAPGASEAFSPLGDQPLLAVVLEGDACPDAAAVHALAALPVPLVALVADPAAPAARAYAPHFDAIAAGA